MQSEVRGGKDGFGGSGGLDLCLALHEKLKGGEEGSQTRERGRSGPGLSHGIEGPA